MLHWNKVSATGFGILMAVIILILFDYLDGIDGRTVLASAPPIYVHINDILLVASIVGVLIFWKGRFRPAPNPDIVSA